MRRLALVATAALTVLGSLAAVHPASAATLSPMDSRIATMLDARVSDPALGPVVVGKVVDSASGQAIWDRASTRQVLPASTLKLATAAAALQAVGPAYRYTTLVRRGSSWGAVVLVGTGDPTLTSAQVAVLARTTAATLRAHGRRSVSVFVDDTAFPAPTNAPGWVSGYVPGQVRPVRALVVDQHHATDTALDAGAVFAAKLRWYGISARLVAHAYDPRGLTVATVRGYTLGTIVTQMLQVSDNDHAEALFRLVARVQHLRPTWYNSRVARARVLSALGISTTGSTMVDGSGLSRYDRMTAAQLVQILQVARSGRFPRLAVIYQGALPRAGASRGALATSLGRYTTWPTRCAAGLLEGKTGALHDVVALAGYARGADGRVKTYAFVLNGLVDAGLTNKRAIDKLAATVTGCY